MTGTDYFEDDRHEREGREANILASTEKRKKIAFTTHDESNGEAEHVRRRSDRAGNPSEGARQGVFNVRRRQIMYNRVVLAARCSVSPRPGDDNDDDCIHRSVDKPNE